jgi:protein-S-isoprenylcysteine O-methyltransferase Ste14
LVGALQIWFLVCAYGIVLAFFVAQRALRRTSAARSFRGGPYDRGNMLLIGAATGIGLLLPIITDGLGVAVYPIGLAAGLVSIAVMLTGFAIRVWAASSLGGYYTTTLMTVPEQKVVTAGPYGWVRHPGYLGEILIWTGFGALSSDLLVALALPVMFVAVLLYRISSEERMLLSELGDDYVRYRRRTRKLVPLVY